MDASAVLVAVPATIAALAAWRASSQTHREVRTNHGVRNGQRIEDLTEDVRFIRRTMVTKEEMLTHTEQDHAFQDRVEPFLTAKEN